MNPFLCKRLPARKQKKAVDTADRLLEYANYRAKIPAIFYWIFGILGDIIKCSCIYTTISRGTTAYVLRNSDRDTLSYRVSALKAKPAHTLFNLE
jgi:hypothetical protein